MVREGFAPGPPCEEEGRVIIGERSVRKTPSASGKMVQFHHGAATVSGECLCIEPLAWFVT